MISNLIQSAPLGLMSREDSPRAILAEAVTVPMLPVVHVRNLPSLPVATQTQVMASESGYTLSADWGTWEDEMATITADTRTVLLTRPNGRQMAVVLADLGDVWLLDDAHLATLAMCHVGALVPTRVQAPCGTWAETLPQVDWMPSADGLVANGWLATF